MSLAPKFYCWPPPPPGFLSQGIQAFFCEDKGHILVLILLITIFHVWVLCVSTNLVFLEWMGLFQLGPPSQKAAQLSEDDHVALHDITCCWLWLRAYMERTFTASVVSQHIELFENGHFDCINILPTLFLKTKPSNQYLGNLWNDWWPNTPYKNFTLPSQSPPPNAAEPFRASGMTFFCHFLNLSTFLLWEELRLIEFIWGLG